MGAVDARIEADTRDPLRDKPSILACRQTTADCATAREQKVAGLVACLLEIVVDRLTCLVCQLELDRALHDRPRDGPPEEDRPLQRTARSRACSRFSVTEEYRRSLALVVLDDAESTQSSQVWLTVLRSPPPMRPAGRQ